MLSLNKGDGFCKTIDMISSLVAFIPLSFQFSKINSVVLFNDHVEDNRMHEA